MKYGESWSNYVTMPSRLTAKIPYTYMNYIVHQSVRDVLFELLNFRPDDTSYFYLRFHFQVVNVIYTFGMGVEDT